jgi:hypothetical protein
LAPSLVYSSTDFGSPLPFVFYFRHKYWYYSCLNNKYLLHWNLEINRLRAAQGKFKRAITSQPSIHRRFFFLFSSRILLGHLSRLCAARESQAIASQPSTHRCFFSFFGPLAGHTSDCQSPSTHRRFFFAFFGPLAGHLSRLCAARESQAISSQLRLIAASSSCSSAASCPTITTSDC